MPYTDPEKRRKAARNWRVRKIQEGYGKALYARRAARYRNEEVLREATEKASFLLSGRTPDVKEARRVLNAALSEAPPIGPPSEYMPS
jgi:hypothetical protein